MSDAGHPETLLEAHRAFEAGNFASARSLALRMRSQSTDEATRAAAESLLARLTVDPLVVGLTAGCGLLFALIVALTFGR